MLEWGAAPATARALAYSAPRQLLAWGITGSQALAA
jgi:hypothetical protein